MKNYQYSNKLTRVFPDSYFLTPSSYRLSPNHGFTIIELLTVLAIIGILAGLVMGSAQEARKRALVAKARASISSLELALGMFQADVGDYPSSGNENLVTCLTTSTGCKAGNSNTAFTSSQAANWSGPYMNFQVNEISGGVFIDPWGRPYGYANPGDKHGTGSDYSRYVDIWSTGPNGIDERKATPKPGDDVVNWRR